VEILNLGGTPERSSSSARKKLRMVLGVTALAAVTGLGSTLAANISLNGGGNVEFGQGVATTAACDGDITLTPVSTFSNASYGYDEPAFALTAIQVTDIDLTPEGWDASANGGEGAWHPEFVYDSHAWNEGYEERSGQYINADGEWTNTCENKVIMIRGYTNNTDYAIRTSNNNISSPIFFNGAAGARGNYDVDGTNTGVGFIIQHDESSLDPFAAFAYEIADSDWSTAFNAMNLDWDFDGTVASVGNNSYVTIELDTDSSNPPSDSRWVDKLTVESSSTRPSGWDIDD